MWQRNAVALASALILISSATSYGQSNLLTQQKWVQIDVVLGRVTATYLRGGQGRRNREAVDELVREQLTVNGDLIKPSLHYEQVDEQYALTFDFVDSTNLEIVYLPLSESGPSTPEVHFSQQDGEPLILMISAGDQIEEYQAESIWHLMVAEPLVCQRHLIRLLSTMRPDWRLEHTAELIEAELFEVAGRNESLTRKQLMLLIDQLDSPRFHQRQLADRQLRDLGVSVLPLLQQLDVASLSNEQRLRIHRIKEHLQILAPDSATRVAAWLVHDQGIWLNLLTHREPTKREAAATHLTGIHPGQIHFDPFAEEALRNEQIARLRVRLRGY